MHLKKCKNKINSENNKINSENNKINSENKQTELLIQLKKEEAKILKLKIKLHQSTKIDNITLKKLIRKSIAPYFKALSKCISKNGISLFCFSSSQINFVY